MEQFTLISNLWNNKDFRKEVKDKIIDYTNDRLEDYNQRCDDDFNSRHPGKQFQVFDKMNDGITKGLYFSDNYLGTKCVGHGIEQQGELQEIIMKLIMKEVLILILLIEQWMLMIKQLI